MLDASAAVELVLQTARADRIAARALHPAERLHAPHLIDVEIAQVMRRMVEANQITVARADAALSDFEGLVIERHAHRPFFRRAWALRASVSAYDVICVAPAEALAAPLLTCDEKRTRAHGHKAKVEVVPVDL